MVLTLKTNNEPWLNIKYCFKSYNILLNYEIEMHNFLYHWSIKDITCKLFFYSETESCIQPHFCNMASHDMQQLIMSLAKFWKCWLLSRSRIPILFCIAWKKNVRLYVVPWHVRLHSLYTIPCMASNTKNEDVQFLCPRAKMPNSQNLTIWKH